MTHNIDPVSSRTRQIVWGRQQKCLHLCVRPSVIYVFTIDSATVCWFIDVYMFFETKQKQETLIFVVWICSLRLGFHLKKGVKDYYDMHEYDRSLREMTKH